MAVYKVPQDVEADDKLIGPFSFRQFIYLIIVAIAMAGAWGLSQIFMALAIIPLPFIVFFAALALPLRKDQPMEAYLSAVVSFYFLKSRKRLWQPDGIDSFVTIIPPKDAERILTKELDETEATRRLDYLSQLVDTHGWAIRGAGATTDTSINTDLYYESQQAPDMMDSTTESAKILSKQLNDEANQQRKEAVDNMQNAGKQTNRSSTTADISLAAAKLSEPTQQPVDTVRAAADKLKEKDQRDAITYANEMAEMLTEQSEPRGVNMNDAINQSTSASTPETGTMGITREQAEDLSKRDELKVRTLAEEANRIAEKNKALRDGDEVTISLR